MKVVEAAARRAAAEDEHAVAEADGRVRPARARPLADGACGLHHNRRLLRLIDAGPSAGCCVKEPRVILTVFPYDIIYLIEGNWFMWTMIRLFRLLTIFYFFEFLRSVLRILKLFLGIEHLSSREEVLMTIAAAVVLTIHWLSCAFQTVHSDNSYIRAVYWSLVSISTTGFGKR